MATEITAVQGFVPELIAGVPTVELEPAQQVTDINPGANIVAPSQANNIALLTNDQIAPTVNNSALNTSEAGQDPGVPPGTLLGNASKRAILGINEVPVPQVLPNGQVTVAPNTLAEQDALAALETTETELLQSPAEENAVPVSEQRDTSAATQETPETGVDNALAFAATQREAEPGVNAQGEEEAPATNAETTRTKSGQNLSLEVQNDPFAQGVSILGTQLPQTLRPASADFPTLGRVNPLEGGEETANRRNPNAGGSLASLI